MTDSTPSRRRTRTPPAAAPAAESGAIESPANASSEPAPSVPGPSVPASPVTAPPAAPLVRPSMIEPTSEDLADAATAVLPGEHRGGFQRELTEPVPIAVTVRPDETWEPAPAEAPPLPRSGWWALTFGILGLIVSFLVGWGFLIGLIGAGLAIAALRRPWESRAVAVWALCLSVVSVIYSAGWLWWASTQGPLFG